MRINDKYREFLHLRVHVSVGGARAQDRAESASAVCTSLYHLVICTLQVPNLGRLPRGHSFWGVNQHKQGYRVLLFLCLHKFSRFLFISYPQGSPFPVRQRLGFGPAWAERVGRAFFRCSSSLHHKGRMNLSWFCQRAERPGADSPRQRRAYAMPPLPRLHFCPS